MAKKLSVLLGLREKVEKNYQNMIDDMNSKFKNKQGLFRGARRTYQAIDQYADDPNKRGFQNVSSTVGEQINWFKDNTKEYLETVFSIEKTNSKGVTAPLIVEGVTWGTYSTLELLRLKSILDSKMRLMVQQLPIREEANIWKPTADGVFGQRDVFETELDEGYSKTTIKETYILPDPHPDLKRQPMLGEKNTQVNVGKYTQQAFSGEITNLQRAQIEVRYNKVYNAVVEALETANNVNSEESDLGEKLLTYIF